MQWIYLICFILLSAGLLALFGVKPGDFIDALFRSQRKSATLSDELNVLLGTPAKGFFNQDYELKQILKGTGRADRYEAIKRLSLILFAVGAVLALLIGNVYMVPILGIGFSLIPIWYLRSTATSYKKHLNEELETAISIITTSYLRTEDLIRSVKENLPYINEPVKANFEAFVYEAELINANITSAINSLKMKIPNRVFHEWCGTLMSTTMKMLLGLVKPTSGTIEIMGKPFNEKNLRDILASVGSLIESPSYYGHLTGRENMEIIRRLLDLPKKNIEEAVHIVRMENQMEKKVKNYSLGMKQRLGIAMALARFPKLLILDEPTNGLDPAGIEEMRELIKMLPKQYGMTVMISSHILSEIDQMATVVGIINQGCLIFQERMSVLDMQREPQIILRTSDNNHAFQLLKKANPQRTTDGLQIGALTDEQTGAVVQCLCSNGISVYRVEEHRESLEDIFLNLTGKELTL